MVGKFLSVFVCGALAGVTATLVVTHFLQLPDAGQSTEAQSAPHGAASSADTVEAAVARLEARLSGGGGTREDWLLLGASYEFLGRQADALRVRARAAEMSADANDLGAALATVEPLLETWVNDRAAR